MQDARNFDARWRQSVGDDVLAGGQKTVALGNRRAREADLRVVAQPAQGFVEDAGIGASRASPQVSSVYCRMSVRSASACGERTSSRSGFDIRVDLPAAPRMLPGFRRRAGQQVRGGPFIGAVTLLLRRSPWLMIGWFAFATAVWLGRSYLPGALDAAIGWLQGFIGR